MALAHPRRRRRHAPRAPADDHRPRRVGGVGERHGGPRARLPRHLPRCRVRASRRQHPARSSPSPSRRASDGARLLAAIAVAYEVHASLVKGDQPPRAEEGPRRRTWRPRSPPASARSSASRPRPSTTRSTRRCTSLRHAPVAEGRDHLLEGLRPGLGREARHRGRGPRDARRGRAEPHLRGRGRRDRLDAGRARTPSTRSPFPAPASGRAGSSRPTRRRTRPSTRPRR